MTQPTLELKFPIIKEAWLGLCHTVRCIRCVHEPVSLLNLLHRIHPYPKTSTEKLNQCGCHKRCPRGVQRQNKAACMICFGFFYRCRCHGTCELVESAVGSSCICNEGLKKKQRSIMSITGSHKNQGVSDTPGSCMFVWASLSSEVSPPSKLKQWPTSPAT